MVATLLDINDSNLQLWEAGSLRLASPGYALLQNSDYAFGAPARAAARLRPRDINTRYWSALDTEALKPSLGPARHSADLVHAHLLQLHREGGEPEALILAVSGAMAREQLALLLGIIGRCPFNAVGLVNRSVLIGSSLSFAERGFHLELQLHQSVISEVRREGDQVVVAATTPLPGCGLLTLQERLVEIIASTFIRQTRFDPRRKAQTEQLLYDALPGALATLRTNAEASLEVAGYRARIERADLGSAGDPLFRAAAPLLAGLGAADQVVLDPLAGLLPGISSRLEGAEPLSNTALAEAAGRHGAQLQQDAEHLSFITTLPALNAPQPSSAPIPEAPPVQSATGPAQGAAQQTAASSLGRAAPQCTHVLLAGVATALSPEGNELPGGWSIVHEGGLWALQCDNGQHALVNGALYQPGQALQRGDSIVTADGTVVQLIEVRAQGG